MHAVITNWRLAKGESVDELMTTVSDRMTEGGESHLPGHIAGYAIETADDLMTMINVYENSRSADASAQALMFIVHSVMEGRAELIERRSGHAFDLRPAISG